MDKNNRQGSFAVIAGAGLIVLGVWLVAERVLGPALEPLRQLTHFLWSIAWPLALIGLGALILARRESLRPTSSITGKRLYRSRSDRMISGVISGIADYLGMEATLLRILYALVTFVGGFGPGVVIYIIASIIIPEEPLGSSAKATPAVPVATPVAPTPPVAPAAPAAPVTPPAPDDAFTPPTS